MKKRNMKILAVLFIGLSLAGNSYSQDNKKLAQTGFQFLSVVSDARAAALGDAMTSLQIGSSALFFNPAGMAEMTNFVDISVSNNQWIADISHNTASIAISPMYGRYGVLGFSLQSVDYGEFYGTRFDRATDYVDTEIFDLSAIALGVGYAKALTDRFSVGGQVRYVNQDLGQSVIPVITDVDTSTTSVTSELSPLAFDFGTQFKTNVKSIVFGMSVRNFSKEIKYVDEGFQLPLVFQLGISMNLMDLMEGSFENQTLYASIDANHYRSHPEQIKVGLEYRYMNMFSLRGGYSSSNDEDGFSFGFGAAVKGLSFDYAYSPFGVFDKVQRMTARFTL